MGFLEILTIVFIILRLCEVITWNWFFVLLPLIIDIVLYIIIIVIKVRAEYY